VIERAELVSGETCVTVCIAVRGIQRGRMVWRQREETGKVRRILRKTGGSDK
jgi:hypothetical protein